MDAVVPLVQVADQVAAGHYADLHYTTYPLVLDREAAVREAHERHVWRALPQDLVGLYHMPEYMVHKTIERCDAAPAELLLILIVYIDQIVHILWVDLDSPPLLDGPRTHGCDYGDQNKNLPPFYTPLD